MKYHLKIFGKSGDIRMANKFDAENHKDAKKHSKMVLSNYMCAPYCKFKKHNNKKWFKLLAND